MIDLVNDDAPKKCEELKVDAQLIEEEMVNTTEISTVNLTYD